MTTTLQPIDEMLFSSASTRAIPREPELSAPAFLSDTNDRWDKAIDALLGWLSAPDEDSNVECLQSAIDFAHDQRASGGDPPSSLLVTDDGSIVFEWRGGSRVVIVSIIESGVADYVLMRDGVVIEHATLRRDPRTRRLELRNV